MKASLKDRLQEDVKAAMRARDKARLGVLRMLSAAIKQVEIDERQSLDDAGVLGVFEKELKKRRDANTQYRAAGRQDLAEQEAYEIDLINGYLPEPLGEAEMDELIAAAIVEAEAASMKDMGRVMGIVKAKAQGRADMSAVSSAVKARLSGG